MISEISIGIREALIKEFGESYSIFTEKQEENQKKPYFLVTCTNPQNERFLGNRYISKNQFLIQYHFDSKQNNKNQTDIVERLFECLEIIKVEDFQIRGHQVKCEIVEDVVNFSVSFDLFFVKKKETEKMGHHIIKNNVKG